MNDVKESTKIDMRERIILETISRVAVLGPTSFNVKDVCASLGISNSLVNHHFGNRDKMLAEITERVYADYVSIIWRVADETPGDAADALRAWMNASVDWNIANSGWALLLNYPVASLEITQAIDSWHKEAMRQWGEYNLARLSLLVHDVRHGTRTSVEWGPGEARTDVVLADLHSVSIAGSIGWATHGMAVWQSGRHLPTSGGIPELVALENQLRLDHIERMIRLITSDIA